MRTAERIQWSEMSEATVLDSLDDLSLSACLAEVEILRGVVQLAVLNDPDTLDPAQCKRPGREKARQYGGAGTPLVADFCCAELGTRLEISSGAAHSLMSDALDMVMRLPRLWRRVEALEVKPSYARFVARKTRDLTREQAAYVDARVVDPADGRVPWCRFEELVLAAIAASDPEAAAAREQAESERQFAKPTRSTEDGMRGFYIRAPFHVIALLDARVAFVAHVLADLGDSDSMDHRRVKAIAILANPHQAVRLLEAYAQWKDRPADPPVPQDSEAPEPADADTSEQTGEKPDIDWSALLPTVLLFVHVYGGVVGEDPSRAEAEGTGIARVEEVAAVTHAWLARNFGPAAGQMRIQPVLDLAGQAPVDAHEIPDKHRTAVHLMTPTDVFPWGTSASRKKQLDHTVPFRHGPPAKGAGQSRIGNYGPMTTYHHRLKTHGGWDVQQPFPGIYLWRDPQGNFYLRDHTGTRRLRPPPDQAA